MEKQSRHAFMAQVTLKWDKLGGNYSSLYVAKGVAKDRNAYQVLSLAL